MSVGNEKSSRSLILLHFFCPEKKSAENERKKIVCNNFFWWFFFRFDAICVLFLAELFSFAVVVALIFFLYLFFSVESGHNEIFLRSMCVKCVYVCAHAYKIRSGRAFAACRRRGTKSKSHKNRPCSVPCTTMSAVCVCETHFFLSQFNCSKNFYWRISLTIRLHWFHIFLPCGFRLLHFFSPLSNHFTHFTEMICNVVSVYVCFAG